LQFQLNQLAWFAVSLWQHAGLARKNADVTRIDLIGINARLAKQIIIDPRYAIGVTENLNQLPLRNTELV
jgi:hypothetical protein